MKGGIVGMVFLSLWSIAVGYAQTNAGMTQDGVRYLPPGVERLMKAYPNFVKGYENGKVRFSDGSEMVYDDSRQKSYVERMDAADLEDMFYLSYDTSVWKPSYLYDPGRVRCEAFFRKMYGNSSNEVQSHLVRVDWFGQKIPFTNVNGAADSLRAVASDLAKLAESYKKYLSGSSSFYWRKVRGADRLSAHSYGIAIDINVKFSDFWLWSNPGKKEQDQIIYKNRIPREIVEIFERHGFISGARWYHYDTMHFEFRPELLVNVNQ